MISAAHTKSLGLNMIKIGSVFSGIGGFELGLERAIPNSQTIWQCEQDKYCRSILQQHWPDAKMYDDITKMDTAEVERPHILCGGFPCQDISVAGKGGGIHGKKSGLYWHLYALISRFRPSIVVLENVPAISFRGAREVLGSLAQIGYDAEWTTISARQFGAPHLRKRWFCIAYSYHRSKATEIQAGRKINPLCDTRRGHETSHSYCKRAQVQTNRKYTSEQMLRGNGEKWNFWKKGASESPLCAVDDGIPQRVARLKALGNAIVPQCSEYIGHCIVRSGLLETIV